MKTISPGRYGFSACAAVAILAGCGGGTQFQNPAAQTPLGNTGTLDRSASQGIVGSNRPDSGSGKVERLRARRLDRVRGGGFGMTSWEDFLARGRAEGAYPGTFIAHCDTESTDYQGRWSWSFTERFIIRSGVSKIKGTISVGGSGPVMLIPGVYQYTTTNGYAGNVKIQSLAAYGGPDRDFREAFEGM